MTIREKAARAIIAWVRDQELVDAVWSEHADQADAAITAFLEAAAEDGWHMRPDEATEEMLNSCPQAQSRGNVGRDRYRALRAAAPKFEWDK